MDNLAPVCIWTLNRHVHLKRCIESLARNKLAKDTDLYISVDYPPSEKYVDGYNKVVDYLKLGIEGFKSVNIFYQKENLGPLDNELFLERLLRQEYEYVIVSEDDSLFSPNFLEYMNQALLMFRDNPKVIGVVARNLPFTCCLQGVEEYARKMEQNGYNSMLTMNGGFNAIYIDKMFDIHSKFDMNFLKEVVTKKEYYKKLEKTNKIIYQIAIDSYLGIKPDIYLQSEPDKFGQFDFFFEIYNIVFGTFFACPTVSKLADTGLDGTGVHCSKSDSQEIEPYDQDIDFEIRQCMEYDPDGYIESIKDTRKIKGYKKSKRRAICCRIVGKKNTVYLINFAEKIRKIAFVILRTLYQPIKRLKRKGGHGKSN